MAEEYSVVILKPYPQDNIEIGLSFKKGVQGKKTLSEAQQFVAQNLGNDDGYRIVKCPRDGEHPCEVIEQKQPKYISDLISGHNEIGDEING